LDDNRSGVPAFSGFYAAVKILRSRVRSAGLRTALAWCALFAAWLLSISLALGICSDACKATYKWTLFGMKFSWFGVLFFLACLLLFAYRRHRLLRAGLYVALAGACGAEIAFLYVQKMVIGKFCPVCVAVAALVYAASLSLAVGYFARFLKKPVRRHDMARHLSKGGFLLAVVFVGCYIAVLGLGNPDQARASGDMTPVLGKADSQVEVYVFTDWFCPACKVAESEMEKAYPEIAKSSKIVFVDFVMHPESANFVPYNMSFVVREKEKYFGIRKALVALAKQTKEPSQEDVQKAVSPLGVIYKPLNFSDINAGMKYYSDLVGILRVDSTPTVVFLNRKTSRNKVLSGVRELTQQGMLSALAEVRSGR